MKHVLMLLAIAGGCFAQSLTVTTDSRQASDSTLSIEMLGPGDPCNAISQAFGCLSGGRWMLTVQIQSTEVQPLQVEATYYSGGSMHVQRLVFEGPQGGSAVFFFIPGGSEGVTVSVSSPVPLGAQGRARRRGRE
jgi:hypothetical protein